MPRLKPSDQPESVRLQANRLQLLFFSWLIPLFIKGAQKDLEMQDIYRVLPEDETRRVGDRLEAAWMEQVAKSANKNESQKRDKNEAGGQGEGEPPCGSLICTGKHRPSLLKALFKVYGPKVLLIGIPELCEETVFKIGQAIVLGYLLDYFGRPNHYQLYDGYIYASGVVVLTILFISSAHLSTYAVQHVGMRMRVGLTALMYRKALRVSKYAMGQIPAGQVTNFLSSDMSRLDIVLAYINYIWIAPIQLLIVICVLYFHADMGYASFGGLILVFLFMPFQGFLARQYGKRRIQTAEKTDDRLLALDEIIAAIRIIKMYTWESPYCEEVSKMRKAEVDKLRKTARCRAMNQSLSPITSRTTLFVTLLIFLLCGNTLTTKTVYMTLTLYQAVQSTITNYLPMAILTVAETLAGFKRIRTFLLQEEKVPVCTCLHERVRKYDSQEVNCNLNVSSVSSEYTYTTESYDPMGYQCGIWAKGISAQWKPDARELSFSNISFEVVGGEVLAIIGPTASGKSSILNALLYELPIKTGDFRISGKVAYSCQEPWVSNGSVRENILFGKPYNDTWYDQVTEACALTRDFHLLAYGDRTLVGENGSELSGGQKARVTLARAVYADADIVLLDDPLSAVDTQVGCHIMEKCIMGLLKNKCRILVTHQLQHVKWVDKVLVIVNGRIAHSGDPKSLQKCGNPFLKMINSPDSVSPARLPGTSSKNVSTRASSSTTGMALESADRVPALDPIPIKVEGDQAMTGFPELEEEYIKKGGVSGGIFYKYFHAGSSLTFIVMMLVLFLFSQFLLTGSDLWLQYWVNIERSVNAKTQVPSNIPIIRMIEQSRTIRIAIYSGMIVALLISYQLRAQLFFQRCLNSSIKIYDKLFYGVIRSPISFFERTPVGRILNRFGRDISIIDEYLPITTYDVITIWMQAFGIACVLAITTPFMLIPSFILLTCCFFLKKFYFRTAISIKRMEGAARSKIYNQFSTTIKGLTTIRAFEVEEKFKRDLEEIHDMHNSCWYLFLCGSRWLGLTVDWLVIFFIAGVELNFLIVEDKTMAGVTITSAMMLTSLLQWGMRQSAEMENHIICLERVLEYCNLEPEADLESRPDKKPPPLWPSAGEIKIRNLCLAYKGNTNATVLKNITCTINGGEKVGIVGRTGAGKSSLVNILFRLAEPTSGYIEIDNIDTTSMGLHDLRSRISIIPQEPVVFGGTIRRNLDPFGNYADEELWKALQEVQLAEKVRNMTGGLEGEISEGGSNFSVGEKQLFCLARCILTSNRILVLDEATASIDPETDELIQNTMRKLFSDCTVITIAHRLNTVMDSDRILVMGAGKIMEFDEPQHLLNNNYGVLCSMVQKTGSTEASNLARIAKYAATRRRQLQDQDWVS